MWNGITLNAICEQTNLLKAWQHVSQNKGSAGSDGITLKRYEKRLHYNLSDLRKQVFRHHYQPKPLKVVWMKKPNGGLRKLAIPSVADRILQTALYIKLMPLLDDEFEEASFGYRPGRSIYHALAELQHAYQQGYQWLVDADIEQYFDNIPHQPLLDLLAGFQLDKALLRLVRQWLRVPLMDMKSDAKDQNKIQQYCHTVGVPQGSPLSPILSNLYLDKFDERFLSYDLKLVRYADDFVVLAKSERSARQALEITEQGLKQLALSLNKSKTSVHHFDDGFEFLGAQIEGSLIEIGHHTGQSIKRLADQLTATRSVLELPIASADQQASDPMRRSLYLNRQGSIVHKQGLRLLVKHKGDIIASVPAPKVDLILLFGHIHLTTPAVQFCLRERIPIIYLTQQGYWIGESTSLPSHGLQTQNAQFSAAESRKLAIAKQFIYAKIQNSLVLLRRLNQRRQDQQVKDQIQAMATHRDALQYARSTDQLMGHEGIAARQYFSAIRTLHEPHWHFNKRQARPAPDPVNALLSFGYSILYNNIRSVLLALGFQPMQGIMHKPASGHAALASDLMEELRPIVIDSLVWSLTLNNKLKPEQFINSNERCELNSEARKLFVSLVEKNLQRRFRYHNGQHVSIRYAIELQARHLARVLKGEDDDYRPLKIK